MNIHELTLQQMKLELWNQEYIWFHQVMNHDFDIVDKILDDMEIYEYSDAFIDNCRDTVTREINDILASSEWYDFVMEYLEEQTDAAEWKYRPVKYYGVRP